jgi:hypothetical protein
VIYTTDEVVEEGHNKMCDFVSSDGLKVGQIEPIRWKHNQRVVTPNAHMMKMKPNVRLKMLEYCDRTGITKQFKSLLLDGKNSTSLEPGQHDEMVTPQGLNWYIQRPPEMWKSNMHWISPLDEHTHDDYLRALGAAGFGEVLQQIGLHFNLDGLVCYHMTFIAVSYCEQGFLHVDVSNTGRRVFNVVFPLMLAEGETGPELDVRQGNGSHNFPLTTLALKVGRWKNQYDVASLMGDSAVHATSAVDYGETNEMRMAATVYIADIGDDNIDAIMECYTQKYPPPDDPQFLLGIAGTHWKRDDSSVQLPTCVGTIDSADTNRPLTWKRNFSSN